VESWRGVACVDASAQIGDARPRHLSTSAMYDTVPCCHRQWCVCHEGDGRSHGTLGARMHFECSSRDLGMYTTAPCHHSEPEGRRRHVWEAGEAWRASSLPRGLETLNHVIRAIPPCTTLAHAAITSEVRATRATGDQTARSARECTSPRSMRGRSVFRAIWACTTQYHATVASANGVGCVGWKLARRGMRPRFRAGWRR
jgi:hypothetical protein